MLPDLHQMHVLYTQVLYMKAQFYIGTEEKTKNMFNLGFCS